MGEKICPLSRRKALKIATGSATATGLITDVTASNRERRVPRIIDMYGETVESMKVSKGWHNHLHSAKERKWSFDTEYLGREGVKRTSVIEDPDKKKGGRTGFRIKMILDSIDYDGDRPDEYRGLDVKIVEDENESSAVARSNTDNTEPTDLTAEPMSHEDSDDCYYNNHNWSTYLGGIPHWRESSAERSGWEPKATHAWLVEYQGNEYIQGARHTYVGCSYGQRVDDEEVHTHDYKIGDVVTWNRSLDAYLATTGAQDFIDTMAHIVNEDGTDSWPVSGIHDETSIATMIINSDQHVSMGASTGRRGSFVQEQYASGSDYNQDCSYDGYGVVSTGDRDPDPIQAGSGIVATGDSGGPAFTIEGGEAHLIYMRTHRHGDNTGYSSCPHGGYYDTALGPAAHRLRDTGYKPITV